jgi:hypothetical protein
MSAFHIILQNFFQGVFLLASLFGLGNLIETDNRKKLIYGTAIFISLTSLLDAMHVCNLYNITILTIGGWIIGALHFKTLKIPKLKKWDIFPIVTGLGVMLLWSYGKHVDNWDDAIGYYPVTDELISHGTSWAPLSLRRAITWGGQFPLQLAFMQRNFAAGGYIYAIYPTIVGLLFIFLPTHNLRTAIICSLLLFISFSEKSNSAPHEIVGVFLAFALLEKNPLKMGLLLGSTCLLRMQSIPFCGLVMVYHLYETWKPERIQSFLKVVVITIAICIPAMINHYSQFKTPFPLLNAGTIHPPFLKIHTDHWLWFKEFLKASTSHIPLFIYLYVTKNKRGLILAGSSLFIIGWVVSDLECPYILRYSFPYIFAVLIYIASTQKHKLSQKYLWLVLLSYTSPSLYRHMQIYTNLKYELQGHVYEAYTLQDKVPKNASIGFIGYNNSSLNTSRNKIYNLDVPGAISQFPKTGELEAWKQWGKTQGIQYLIIPKTDLIDFFKHDTISELHYRKVWTVRKEIGAQLEILKKEQTASNEKFTLIAL